MINAEKLFNVPIPGENLTVNSKNYAWHRPPQFPEFDDAFEFFIDEFFGNGDRINSAAIMASFGISAVGITQTLMVNAVGGGKISPDMSLLLAGPVYTTLTKTFDRLGVDYLSGFDTREELEEFSRTMKSPSSKPKTKSSALSKAQEKEMEEMSKDVKSDIPTGGLMGAKDENEKPIEIPMEDMGTGLVLEKDTKEGES